MRNLIVFFIISIGHCFGFSQYYIAPASIGGNDSNNGTSISTPWLTPNHAVNCGDTILALSSNVYLQSNFQTWGTVTCSGGNNVVWLKCIVFDTCITTITNGNGMTIGKSYWGVQGWEIDGTVNSNYCFLATPSASSNIHHIIFANNIAIGCGLAGFEAGNNATFGVDYFNEIGNIVYGTSGGSSSCGSGLYVFSPVATDSLSGTHIYLAGNFSWSNKNTNPCGGTTPTDGEGLIFDTFDGSGTFGSGVAYAQQAVAANNILIGNGGRGIEVVNNNNGSSPWATIYFTNNTIWGNNLDQTPTYGPYICGEVLLLATTTTFVSNNLVEASSTNGCDSGITPIYLFWTTNSATNSNRVFGNFGFSPASMNTNTNNSTGFSFGANIFGANPKLINPVIPVSPNCSGFINTVDCMGLVISNFKPTLSLAIPYGYQIPSGISVYDPLYPIWLCNVTLPIGLVTPGCSGSSSILGGSEVIAGSILIK